MRYAFMSFSTPTLTLDEMLACAKAYGYDGIEPRAQAKHAHGIEFDASPKTRRDAGRKAREQGIALCCLALSCRFADPQTSAQHTDDALRGIDLAADCGIPLLRVFGGALGPGLDRQSATQHAADCLRRVMPHAEDRAVTLCLETHDDWCDPAHVAELMRAVDHPRLAVNWDIMHPVRVAGKTMDEAFATLRPWIKHVHVHDGANDTDGKLQMLPIGQGVIDHGRALRLLHDAGYQGYLSGEWIKWEPHDVHLPREREAMRRLDP